MDNPEAPGVVDPSIEVKRTQAIHRCYEALATMSYATPDDVCDAVEALQGLAMLEAEGL